MIFPRAALVALPLLATLPLAAPAAADAQNASVDITDSGFSPAVVNIPIGGSVTWSNKGTNVHTATSTPAATSTAPQSTPAPFDSGGIGPGQTFNFAFIMPGTYVYTSATDCLNGNTTPGFACTGHSVAVGAPVPAPVVQPAPIVPPAPTGGPPPAPPGTTLVQSATISITDSGFQPSSVALSSGGNPSSIATLTFVNNGTTVHTAITGASQMVDQRFPPEAFDTGGLAPGESRTVGFIQAGTYAFNSAVDCLNGNSNPQFDCGTPHSITVVIKAPVGANVAAPPPPFAGSAVYIKDDAGFEPANLAIKPGQTVTWLNLGHTPHNVSSDSSIPFDSGGMGVGSVFSVTFPNPGAYRYHSSTEPIWSGSQITGYQFNGTIVVQP
jgi:plastocyanin